MKRHLCDSCGPDDVSPVKTASTCVDELLVAPSPAVVISVHDSGHRALIQVRILRSNASVASTSPPSTTYAVRTAWSCSPLSYRRRRPNAYADLEQQALLIHPPLTHVLRDPEFYTNKTSHVIQDCVRLPEEVVFQMGCSKLRKDKPEWALL